MPPISRSWPKQIKTIWASASGPGEWKRFPPETRRSGLRSSISKVITLMVALQHCGFNKVFEKMNMEPSGDAFNSLVKLDLTSDKPFNPMINAGAITTAGYLVPDVSFEDMLNYARRLCLDKDIVMDEKVFRSEMDHCARNRAIAYLLQSKGILESDVEKSLELYTRMCSLSVTAESLAGLGLALSNGAGIRRQENGLFTNTLSRWPRPLC